LARRAKGIVKIRVAWTERPRRTFSMHKQLTRFAVYEVRFDFADIV
jgi:hypothetical protein